MKVETFPLAGVRLIHLDAHGDGRGLFVETFDTAVFEAAGIPSRFVQDAISVSAEAGTLRGMHFQAPPRAQAKLVRVARGRILDVVVDLRPASDTYGGHMAVELAAPDWRMLFVPQGFAHGFLTLEPDTEIAYKLSDHYAPDLSMGVRWDDPDLGIAWPIGDHPPRLSDRDRALPGLAELGPVFG